MSAWRTVALGDVTERVASWNPKATPDSKFRYVDLSAIDNRSKSIVSSSDLLGREAPSRARQLIQMGDVLVSTVRPNLNAVATVTKEYDGATASTGFAVLRPTSRVHRTFLSHWVRSSIFINDMVRKATGVSYPAVSDRIVKESSLPLPPLAEQRRVAAILDEADTIRAKRRAQLSHLDDLSQSLFHETFGSITRTAKASKLMPSMRNGVSPSTGGTFDSRVLTLSAITRGRFDPTAAKDASFAAEPGQDKRLSRHDFLICRGNGNKSFVGVGHAPHSSDLTLVFPDTMIAGRINDELISMPYLEAVWQTRGVRRQIERVARTTNGTYKVNQTALGSVDVPLPPLAAQKEYATKLTEIETERTRISSALEADYELFSALQDRAFRGEL